MKIILLISILFSFDSYAQCTAGTKASDCKDTIAIAVTPQSSNSTYVTPKMKADMLAKLNGQVIPNLGDSMSWANGTLTRTKKGELRYTTSTPVYYSTTITSTTDLGELAAASSSVNDQFISDYGVDLVSNNAVAQEALKARIDEVATKGAGAEATKEKPLALGNNISAYTKDGATVFQKKKDDIKLEDLKKTNEYKALVGANINHDTKSGTATVAKSSATSTNIGNLDYICKAKDSSMMMLVQAAEQYKNKTITKDQFVEVALTASKMGDYNDKVANAINEKGINLPAPSTPGAVGTSNVVTSSVTSCLVNNACVPYVPCGPVGSSSSSSDSSSGNVSK